MHACVCKCACVCVCACVYFTYFLTGDDGICDVNANYSITMHEVALYRSAEWRTTVNQYILTNTV